MTNGRTSDKESPELKIKLYFENADYCKSKGDDIGYYWNKGQGHKWLAYSLSKKRWRIPPINIINECEKAKKSLKKIISCPKFFAKGNITENRINKQIKEIDYYIQETLVLQSNISFKKREEYISKSIELLSSTSNNQSKKVALNSINPFLIEYKKFRRISNWKTPNKFQEGIIVINRLIKYNRYLNDGYIHIPPTIFALERIKKEMEIRNDFLNREYRVCKEKITDDFLNKFKFLGMQSTHEESYKLLKLACTIIDSKELLQEDKTQIQHYIGSAADGKLIKSFKDFVENLYDYYLIIHGNDPKRKKERLLELKISYMNRSITNAELDIEEVSLITKIIEVYESHIYLFKIIITIIAGILWIIIGWKLTPYLEIWSD